ncbi:hypothetical protein FBU31_001040 [Coemansia sp. 'formosensis']|nr:hypothetical protein FBU31_001040 [Coemansia sp. 'formosensis']
MKLSSHVLVCALAATTAVAAPGFEAERRGLDDLLNAGNFNAGALGDITLLATNRDDVDKYKSASEREISALLAGKIDEFYSYAGDAALIVDKYMPESDVASIVSQILPMLKVPSNDPEFNKINASFVSRLSDPAVQHHFASAMKVVNDIASYYAEYANSKYGIDIYSIMAANIRADEHQPDEDAHVPPTPTGTLSTTPKPSPASSSSDTSKPSPASSSSESSSSTSSSHSSDSKTNGAGSNAVKSLGMFPLGIAISALVAFF